MALRLPTHDALRGSAVEVQIGDTTVRAYTNESLAVAALASQVGLVMSRSLKYHRPRSMFCLEGHCSGCLVRIDGVPNLRACQIACHPGAELHGQNAFPSTEVDLLGAVDFLFARGMDHHTLMTSSSVLNKLANKVVRQLSGLGKLPARAVHELPEVGRREVDVCVIGGGPAGLAAATAAARAGRTTLLVDDQLRPGGSLRADPRLGRDVAEQRWQDAIDAGVEVFARTTAIGFFPEDGRGVAEQPGQPTDGVLAVASAERMYRVYARAWIWATGGYAVNLPFPDNDRPGVLAARAVGRLLVDHGILGGDKICVIEVPEVRAETDALVTALTAAGAEVMRIPLPAALGVRGRGWVTAVDGKLGQLECDLVAVAAIPAPASEGARQQGCRVVLDPEAGGFRVVIDDDGRTTTPNVWACGDVCGFRGPLAASEMGARVGALVAAELT